MDQALYSMDLARCQMTRTETNLVSEPRGDAQLAFGAYLAFGTKARHGLEALVGGKGLEPLTTCV
jgi:hypothetical protein